MEFDQKYDGTIARFNTSHLPDNQTWLKNLDGSYCFIQYCFNNKYLICAPTSGVPYFILMEPSVLDPISWEEWGDRLRRMEETLTEYKSWRHKRETL